MIARSFSSVSSRLAAWGLVFCLCLGLAGPAAAQQRPRNESSSDYLKSSPKFLAAFRDSVARAARSTVRVRCDGKDVALGTVVAADGWILTKASQLNCDVACRLDESLLVGKGVHTIIDQQFSDVTCRLGDGRVFTARVVGVHEPSDLALLKIAARELTPVEWQDSKRVPVGSWVATPGTQLSPVAVGVLSVAARKIAATHRPKNSGFLGVSLGPPARGGVKLAGVLPGTGALRAGLKTDDLILSVDGKPTADAATLQKTLGKLHPGDVVIVRIKRGKKELEKRVTLGKRPLDRGDFQNSLGSELSERRDDFPLAVQHDTVLRPTDCGGPLVDLDGKVLGVNIARGGRTESFAIPSEAVRSLLADLQSGKLAPKEHRSGPTGKPMR